MFLFFFLVVRMNQINNRNPNGYFRTKQVSAFDDFKERKCTISIDNDEITIESTGLPNHTSPYWEETHPLYIDPVVFPKPLDELEDTEPKILEVYNVSLFSIQWNHYRVKTYWNIGYWCSNF